MEFRIVDSGYLPDGRVWQVRKQQNTVSQARNPLRKSS